MKKKTKYLTFLLIMDWIAELICFIAVVVALSLATIILLNDIFSIPLDKIHYVSLIILYFLVVLGVVITSKFPKVIMSENYYRLLTSVSLISLFSYKDFGSLDALRNNIQLFSVYLMAILLLMILFIRQYPKLIHRAIYKKEYQLLFNPELEDVEEIKAEMLGQLTAAISDKYKDSVVVVGKNFAQDTEGNIRGIFKIMLDKKMFNISRPKLIETTINFKKSTE